MKWCKINDDIRRRALVLFTGWGMDANPFRDYSLPGYDLIVAWDYRDLNFQTMDLDGYDEIAVVGWSFGVTAAAQFVAEWQDRLPITLCAAVNGTCFPISDTRGIPEHIFQGTRQGLSERSLMKFYRHISGSMEAYRALCQTLPERSLKELDEELEAIEQRGEVSPEVFDVAYTGRRDLIFPLVNQQRAWTEAGVKTVEIDEPHLPTAFPRLLESIVVNKERVADKFSDSLSTYDDNAVVQRTIATELAKIIPEGSYDTVLEVGVGSGFLTEHIRRVMHPRRLLLNDVIPILPSLKGSDTEVVEGDMEIRLRDFEDESLDGIVSSSAIQWFNSPLRFLRRALRKLRPGGILAVSAFGHRNYEQLRQGGMWQGIHYLEPASLNRIEGLQVTDNVIVTTFTDLRSLMDHMRLTGVTGTTGVSHGEALRRLRHYPGAQTGVLPLTYHPVFIYYRKPCN